MFVISGYKGQFKWFEYLRQTKSSAAPVKLFDKVFICILYIPLIAKSMIGCLSLSYL